jgi:hypothetical protein
MSEFDPVVVSISGKPVLVQASWRLFENPKESEKEILNSASSSRVVFGYIGKTANDFEYYATFDKDSAGFIIGAALVKKELQPNKSIFFAKIDEEEYSDTYWVLVLDDEGTIVIDGLYRDKDVTNIINSEEYTEYEKYTTYASVSDVSLFNVINFANIYDESYESSSDRPTVLIDNSINKSKVRVVIIVAVLIIAISFLVFFKKSEYQAILNGDFSYHLAKHSSYINKIDGKYKEPRKTRQSRRKNSSDDIRDSIKTEEIAYAGKVELLENFEKNYFTNEDLFHNIHTIIDFVPIKVINWDLTSMWYKDNSFYIKYRMRSEAQFKANYKLLDGVIKEVSNNKNIIIQEKLLDVNGTERLYEIIFFSGKRSTYLKKVLERNEIAESKRRIKSQIESSIKKVKDIQSSIKNEIISVSDLNWYQKRFGDTLTNISSKISGDDGNIASLVKRIKSLDDNYQRILESKYIDSQIESSWTESSFEEYIIMMQDYSDFSWEYPSNYNTIPSEFTGADLLRSDVISRVWPLSVTTSVNNDKTDLSRSNELDFNNIDANDMKVEMVKLQNKVNILLHILNKKNIIINEINLNFENERFQIEGEFYEKSN